MTLKAMSSHNQSKPIEDVGKDLKTNLHEEQSRMQQHVQPLLPGMGRASKQSMHRAQQSADARRTPGWSRPPRHHPPRFTRLWWPQLQACSQPATSKCPAALDESAKLSRVPEATPRPSQPMKRVTTVVRQWPNCARGEAVRASEAPRLSP
jgi:hypothetical protein